MTACARLEEGYCSNDHTEETDPHAPGIEQRLRTPPAFASPVSPTARTPRPPHTNTAITAADSLRTPQSVRPTRLLDRYVDAAPHHSEPSILSAACITSKFAVYEKVGEGTFSVVYRAQPKDPRLLQKYPDVVLKVLTRTCEAQGRILREAQLLQRLQTSSNVQFASQLIGAVRENGQVIFVLDYFPHDRFSSALIRSFSVQEVRFYMVSLFSCIAFVHSKGIVHRDIKPSNFLYSTEIHQGVLIDLGLAQLEEDARVPIPHRSKQGEEDATVNGPGRTKKLPYPRPHRAGTRGYRSPEVLMKTFHQSKALDIWSAGIVMLSLLSRRTHVLDAPDDDNQALFEIIQLFGNDAMERSAMACGRVLKTSKAFAPHDVGKYCDPIFPTEALDLLRRCLDCNPDTRINAVEALRHPFLADVTTAQSTQVFQLLT
eukprot:TRINITY_DN6206_c0_g1_i1.p1 TRINITY_DN6206_c0_g1~~TRINITY_DN6206_c0_g1_i1.p1  ORF type:complete len:497 (-),score=85.33 TRINITY_DN6206_c0_g1_i1:326-1615(-)